MYMLLRREDYLNVMVIGLQVWQLMSLPSHIREAVRDLGQSKTSRSPSALLMARIRQVYPSFVELDEQAHEQWTSEPARMLNYHREFASICEFFGVAPRPRRK